MRTKVERCLCILIFFASVLCSTVPTIVLAAERRNDIIWINGKSDDVTVINLNVYKTRIESFGLEFTSPKSTEDPQNFTSGNYFAQGMIRLTRNDEFVFRTNGGWISSDQESEGGLIKEAFSRDEWHCIKVEFNRAEKTIGWYLDGSLLGTTPTKNDVPMNAISVFCDSVINDGLKIIASEESTDRESSAAATATYKYTYRNVQGKNNWYFCEFGEYSEREMAYRDGQWRAADSVGYIGRGVMHPGEKSDTGVKYIAHKNGVVRLKGGVRIKEADGAKGDGVVGEIYLGSKPVWCGNATYGNDAEYNITLSIKQGDAISFRINKNKSVSYDWTDWAPTVDYIDVKYYPAPENCIYYQRFGVGSVRENLTYNNSTERYEGDGGYFDGREVSLNAGYTLGKSYTVFTNGRYRLNGMVTNDNAEDVIVRVQKDDEVIWSQMIPSGESGKIDIRAYLTSGDALSAEVLNDNPSESETVRFDVGVEKIPGTAFCSASTSQGFGYNASEEYSLGDLIGTRQGENGMKYYFIYRDKKHEMEYNADNQRWENTGDSGGYISKTAAYPGAYTETVMEWSAQKDGTLRIDGDMHIADSGDGTLCRIYKNDEVIWTNRVGGERLVRWDEPYDTSYFSNNINVVTPLNRGDKITFLFNQWRLADNDYADFSNVKLSYISGEILSETTKWKLKSDVVFDTENKRVYKDKVFQTADIYSDGGEVYISKDTVNKIFGTNIESNSGYITLFDAVSESGKNVVIQNELAVVYGGLPMKYGYAELSELNAMLNPTVDSDPPIKYGVTDTDGKDITQSVKANKQYYLKLNAENYMGESYNARVMLCEYTADGVLTGVRDITEFEMRVGTKYSTDREIGFVTDNGGGYIRIYVWNEANNNPLAQSLSFGVTE